MGEIGIAVNRDAELELIEIIVLALKGRSYSQTDRILQYIGQRMRDEAQAGYAQVCEAPKTLSTGYR